VWLAFGLWEGSKNPMFRPNWKYLTLGLVLVGTLLMGASQAEAFWYYGGCWGCGPYYSACSPCGGGWYVGYRPGPIRRLLFGPYRWYYGGWGCCGTYAWECCYGCWDTCCYDPCCSTTVSTPAAAAPSSTPTPAKPGPQEPTPAEPSPVEPDKTNPQTSLPIQGTSALMAIRVPAEAKVFINGLPTKSTGVFRQYVSHGLKPGHTYKYEVRAEITRQGRTVESTRTVFLTAGARQAVALDFDAASTDRLATVW